jgi:hypothetical protein
LPRYGAETPLVSVEVISEESEEESGIMASLSLKTVMRMHQERLGSIQVGIIELAVWGYVT